MTDETKEISLGVRVSQDIADRIDLLLEYQKGKDPLGSPTRSDVIRAALDRGLDSLAKELGLISEEEDD